jgi:hypothetical protein
MRNDPQTLASLQQSYFLYKGLAKAGHGLAALDDMTGNVVSGGLRKIGERFEWLGTQVRRRARNDLGFSQRTAQNAGDIAEIAAQIFVPTVAGNVVKPFVAAGITKFRANVAGAFTRVGEGVISGESIGLSWTGNWFERGYAFERYLERIFPEAKLPDRFKTFDFFEKGTAISAKTLDTNTLSRITKPELVRYQTNSYINSMIDFTEYELEGVRLTSSQITAKELHLAIPANASPIHMQQIMHSVQYGVYNGIKVVVTKVK